MFVCLFEDLFVFRQFITVKMELLVLFFFLVCLSNAREIKVCWNQDEGFVEKQNDSKTDIGFPVAGAVEQDICKIIEECNQDADPASSNNTQNIMVPIKLIPQSSKHDEVNFITGIELSIWRSMKEHVAKWEAESNTTVQGICFSMDVLNSSHQQPVIQTNESDECYVEYDWSLLSPRDFNSSVEERNDGDSIQQMSDLNSTSHKYGNKIQIYKISNALSWNATADVCTKMDPDNTTNQDNGVLKFLHDFYALENDNNNNQLAIIHHHDGGMSDNASNVCTHELMAICELHDNNYTTIRDEDLPDSNFEHPKELVLFELNSCLNNESTMSHHLLCNKSDRVQNSTLDPNFTLHKFFQRSASKIKKECIVLN